MRLSALVSNLPKRRLHHRPTSIMRSMGKNRYGLPEDDLSSIRERDRVCVYCHKPMIPVGSDGPQSDWATIEHLNHKPPWNNPNTVAICCWSCNSSRGNQLLRDWFLGEYCRSKGIDRPTVAEPVRNYLRDVEDHI